MKVEYPKMLYSEEGWLNLDAHITVNDVEEEKIARESGFKCLDDIVVLKTPKTKTKSDG